MIPHNLVCVSHVSFFLFRHIACVFLPSLPLSYPDHPRRHKGVQHIRFDLISIALTRGDAPRDMRVPLPAARPPPGNRCSPDRAVTRGRTRATLRAYLIAACGNFRTASAYTHSSVRLGRVTRGTRASRLLNYFGTITSQRE